MAVPVPPKDKRSPNDILEGAIPDQLLITEIVSESEEK